MLLCCFHAAVLLQRLRFAGFYFVFVATALFVSLLVQLRAVWLLLSLDFVSSCIAYLFTVFWEKFCSLFDALSSNLTRRFGLVSSVLFSGPCPFRAVKNGIPVKPIDARHLSDCLKARQYIFIVVSVWVGFSSFKDWVFILFVLFCFCQWFGVKLLYSSLCLIVFRSCGRPDGSRLVALCPGSPPTILWFILDFLLFLLCARACDRTFYLHT